MTFYFDARMPASRAFLEPLREIVRQAYQLAGYPDAEAGTMAGAIETLVGPGLPADHARGDLHLRLERDQTEFHVDVTAAHLPMAPPPAGLMDRVSVHSDAAGMRHRFTRRLPRA